MSAINLVATADAYSPAATLTCPPTGFLTVQVNNAAVYYQLFITHDSVPGRPGGGSIADTEKVLSPGYWNFTQADFQNGLCLGIQFRSAVAGTPATVSASN